MDYWKEKSEKLKKRSEEDWAKIREYRSYTGLKGVLDEEDKRRIKYEYNKLLNEDKDFQEYHKLYKLCNGRIGYINRHSELFGHSPNIAFKLCGFPTSKWSPLAFTKKNLDMVKEVCLIAEANTEAYKYFELFYKFSEKYKQNDVKDYEIINEKNEVVKNIRTSQPWYELGKLILNEKYSDKLIVRKKEK